jgi:hypothetical protein
MPAFPVRADRILVGLDDHQLGMARLVRRRGVQVQLAELPAEIEVLVLRHVLVAEEDDEVLGQRPVDLVHLPVGDRPAERDAADLGADQGRQAVHPDRLIGLAGPGAHLDAGTVEGAEGGHGAFLLCRALAKG